MYTHKITDSKQGHYLYTYVKKRTIESLLKVWIFLVYT